MSKYTPGPWNYSFESVDPEWAVVSKGGGAIVANVNADSRKEANARLIAAAPEMAEALLEMIFIVEQYIKDCGPCDHAVNICVCGENAELDQAKAALKKAGVL